MQKPRWVRITLAAGIVTAYLVAMIYSTAPARAQQTAVEVKVAELERRFAVADADHLSERIARVETAVETNNRLLVAVLAAVTLMILERVAQMKGKPRREVSEG